MVPGAPHLMASITHGSDHRRRPPGRGWEVGRPGPPIENSAGPPGMIRPIGGILARPRARTRATPALISPLAFRPHIRISHDEAWPPPRIRPVRVFPPT